MKEVWKDVKGYEGIYEVSNYGRVRSLDKRVKCAYETRIIKGKVLSTNNKPNEYKTFVLCDAQGNRKTVRPHRLVAEAFIPNPKNLPQVNHKDEDKTNNCADNLEWCDNKYNNNYGNKPEKMSRIRGITIEQYDKNGDLKSKYNSITKAEKIMGYREGFISEKTRKGEAKINGYIWRRTVC